MLKKILATELILVGSISIEEARHLEKQLAVSELALHRFLKAEISFADYLEIMELCGTNIDDYLITIEDNLAGEGITI